eukprot:NODE_18_length_2621_cov_624.894246_g15_i0.p1 GENE.NODE_18_length_2621_cov_624.894246_g15_i0~~NODE_18_length_2621_cov_624.894246_g15_i0.p1  ORF type:complete len:346 (+),score=45.58 NODE_18_length_2621_cov_624.894246_g15_i0:1328-2365(+)
MSDADLEDEMERVVTLFEYIDDRDLFSEFYRKQLSKRLLTTRVSDDNERSLISKLKIRCGAPYTSKLEGMISDRNLSEDLQSKFKEWLKDKEYVQLSPPFDFIPTVLTSGFWPAFKQDTLDCPVDVQKSMATFKQFYDQHTQSRVLKWVHSLGFTTLLAHFRQGEKELAMTSYQACVLLLFNSADVISAQDIQLQLQIPWEEVKKCLQSLALGKYKILLRPDEGDSGKKKDVKETDSFQFNDGFTERQRKLKIQNVVPKITPKNSQQVHGQVEDDRKHAIEACIVRVMKSRKCLEHAQLVSECISQLGHHFKPDPRVIKRRIEDLIAREYLERDSEKTSLYRYLA